MYELLPDDGIHLDPSKAYLITVFNAGKMEGILKLINKDKTGYGQRSANSQKIPPSLFGETIPTPSSTYKVINDGNTTLKVLVAEQSLVA